jgi:hypothetical protein
MTTQVEGTNGEQEMTFTDAGLARIMTPEFLLTLQQLPQDQEAILFLALAACSDEDGTLMLSSEDEPFYFIRSHRKRLADLMVEATDSVIAIQNALFALES